MKHLKLIGLAAVAVMALTAFFGAGTASATELYKYTTPSANDTLGVGTEIVATVTGSATLEDTEEDLLVDTCTTSEVKGKITSAGGAASHPSGGIETLTFGNCSHTTDVLQKGSLEIRHIAGTTNGTVISKEAQVTVQSTIFGISCTANTGATGTALGTLTGAKSSGGHATMAINALIPMGFFCGGDARWTGSYTVTSPTGLTVEAS